MKEFLRLVILIATEIYFIHNFTAQWLTVTLSIICLIIATFLYLLSPLFNYYIQNFDGEYSNPFRYSIFSLIGSAIIIAVAILAELRPNTTIYWPGIFGTAIIIPISTYVNCKLICWWDHWEMKRFMRESMET